MAFVFGGNTVLPGNVNVTGVVDVDGNANAVGNIVTTGKTTISSVVGQIDAVGTAINYVGGALTFTGSNGIYVTTSDNDLVIGLTAPINTNWPVGPASAVLDLQGFSLYSSVGNGNVTVSGGLYVSGGAVDTTVVIECLSSTTFYPPFVPCRLMYTIIGGGGGGGGGGIAPYERADAPPCGGGGASGTCKIGSVILTSPDIITFVSGSGGLGGAANILLNPCDSAGGSGGITSFYNNEVFVFIGAGVGGGGVTDGLYGAGGGGFGGPALPQWYGGPGSYIPNTVAAGGGYGTGPSYGGGGGGVLGPYTVPGALASNGQAGPGDSLFGGANGGGDVGGGIALPFHSGGGGGGIKVVSTSMGGSGGVDASTGRSSAPGGNGVAGGGGGGGGGGYASAGNTAIDSNASPGGNGGHGAGRFVFTSLCNA